MRDATAMPSRLPRQASAGLRLAARMGSPHLLRMLLEKGAAVNGAVNGAAQGYARDDDDGATPLMLAG